jgi:hypothetical protein
MGPYVGIMSYNFIWSHGKSLACWGIRWKQLILLTQPHTGFIILENSEQEKENLDSFFI